MAVFETPVNRVRTFLQSNLQTNQGNRRSRDMNRKA